MATLTITVTFTSNAFDVHLDGGAALPKAAGPGANTWILTAPIDRSPKPHQIVWAGIGIAGDVFKLSASVGSAKVVDPATTPGASDTFPDDRDGNYIQFNY
jgi:hypothetical protein